MELEPSGNAVKLCITHAIEREPSKLIEAVAGGWPNIISKPQISLGDRSDRAQPVPPRL
jgi:hypothetical protein